MIFFIVGILSVFFMVVRAPRNSTYIINDFAIKVNGSALATSLKLRLSLGTHPKVPSPHGTKDRIPEHRAPSEAFLPSVTRRCFTRLVRQIGPALGVCMYLCVQRYRPVTAKPQPTLRAVKAIRDAMLL